MDPGIYKGIFYPSNLCTISFKALRGSSSRSCNRIHTNQNDENILHHTPKYQKYMGNTELVNISHVQCWQTTKYQNKKLQHVRADSLKVKRLMKNNGQNVDWKQILKRMKGQHISMHFNMVWVHKKYVLWILP